MQTHCRFLPHIAGSSHVSHIIKMRFIKFMSSNINSSNDYIKYIANLCYSNASSPSGRNVSEIISEYGVSYDFMYRPLVLKSALDVKYNVSINDDLCSRGEEWKIGFILELIDCLNGHQDNGFIHDENAALLHDVCTA